MRAEEGDGEQDHGIGRRCRELQRVFREQGWRRLEATAYSEVARQ